MKVLYCGLCGDIRAFDYPGPSGWTVCHCGNVEARWLDPLQGTVKVRAADKSKARIIGLNNRMLTAAWKDDGPLHDNEWKEAHAEAVKAPGYVFDESKRACWACIVKVNQTADISWEEETLPWTVSISVNGKILSIPHTVVSYEYLISLEGYAPHRILSVVYRYGPCIKPEGMLCPGESVRAVDGMKFNIADTSSA